MIDEANLLNRLDLVLDETGYLLSLNEEMQTIMYLSNAAEARMKKRGNK